MDYYERHVANQKSDLAGRVIAIRAVIHGKVSDSAAHASKALSDVVFQLPEGRPTAAKLRSSRSYLAALTRLDELLKDLATAVENCRVETYETSYDFWWAYHEPTTRRYSDPEPPASYVDRCRVTMLHGHTVRQFLAGSVERAKSQLLSRLVLAGNRQTSPKGADEIIRTWQDVTARNIIQTATTALVDSQSLADRRAGRDAIKRDLLHDDPSLND